MKDFFTNPVILNGVIVALFLFCVFQYVRILRLKSDVKDVGAAYAGVSMAYGNPTDQQGKDAKEHAKALDTANDLASRYRRERNEARTARDELNELAESLGADLKRTQDDLEQKQRWLAASNNSKGYLYRDHNGKLRRGNHPQS